MTRAPRTLPQTRVPAECFPPGEFIQEEMVERGWTRESLADTLKWQRDMLDAVLEGKVELTNEMAHDLADGFGVSHHFWLNVEFLYRRWLRHQPSRRTTGRGASSPEVDKP